jgi:hypothetical protein
MSATGIKLFTNLNIYFCEKIKFTQTRFLKNVKKRGLKSLGTLSLYLINVNLIKSSYKSKQSENFDDENYNF